MKALGVVEGVADFELVSDGRVDFIEMKTDIGKQSAAQKEFQRMVNERGHYYHIVRTVEEFKNLIKSIYG
jgi:hypothetical protein